ncbi:hypothetical protein [Sedimentitalea sp.]|uniref:hypothetical protein n=1 Tax=Sedimentitalea sp. TaxID=2048915 RepID=UPI00329A16D4
MNDAERTVIIIEDNVGFSPSDLMLAWNAEQSDSDLPMASLQEKGKTFDATLLSVVGDAANILTILGFIGVPTIAATVQKLRNRRSASRTAADERQPQFVVDVIDLSEEGKIQRIVIRRTDS